MSPVAITSYNEANKGKKVEFIKTNFKFKHLNPGDTGIYKMSFKIPAMPIQHLIDWDNGKQRILIEGVDNFKFVNKTKKRNRTCEQHYSCALAIYFIRNPS